MSRPQRPSAICLASAFTLSLLGAPGCSGDVETVDAFVPEDRAAFQVGTGERAFLELDPGATVPMTAGLQGGFHIWVSVRCGDCGPDLALSYGVEDAVTGEPISQPGLQAWATFEEVDGWRQVTGLTAFLNGFDPEAYEGRRARFFARSAADDGSPLEAEAEATVSGIDEGF